MVNFLFSEIRCLMELKFQIYIFTLSNYGLILQEEKDKHCENVSKLQNCSLFCILVRIDRRLLNFLKLPKCSTYSYDDPRLMLIKRSLLKLRTTTVYVSPTVRHGFSFLSFFHTLKFALVDNDWSSLTHIFSMFASVRTQDI